jgi:TolA-binding protein
MISTTSTTTTTSTITAPHRDDQIQQLEWTVRELQQQLQQERENNARILKKEREDAQELLQGMQLRLHISETRTRIFEEALAAHVDAVAQNVALHPTKNNNHNNNNNNNNKSSRSPIITLLNQSHPPPSPSSPLHSSSRYLDNANTTHRTRLNPPRATLFSRGSSSSSSGGTWRTPGVGDEAA